MNNFCQNCGEKLSEGADVCLKCGSKATIATQSKKKKFPTWAIIIIVIFGILFVSGVILSIIGYSIFDKEDTKLDCISEGGIWYNDKCTIEENDNNNESTKKYEINKPFKFDDLEITIGDQIQFTALENEYSDYNGKDIVKIPVTVKNLKSTSHNLNMFYYKVFSPKGTEAESVNTYFLDDDVAFASELRTDASYTKYIHVIYEGNGKYYIQFNDFYNKMEVEINITK